MRQRIKTPLADARGSDRSHDREGMVLSKYETVFMKRGTKLSGRREATPIWFRKLQLPQIFETAP
jgi:hypothetical protein